MIVEEWTVKCSYKANVIVTGELSEHVDKKALHPAINKVEFSNNRAEGGNYTGKLDLIIDYSLDIEDDQKNTKDKEMYAKDLGFDLLSMYVNLISFYSGNRIEKIGTVSIKHKIDENKTRHIIEGEFEERDNRLIKLNIDTLIPEEIDSKLNRVISFYVYGQNAEEEDALNSFILLMSALDMLSGIFKYDDIEKKNRVCKKCHHKEKLDVSTSQKVRYLLIKYSNCSESEANKIWEDRTKIAHGAFHVNSKSLRELRNSISLVKRSLIKGIKDNLNLGENHLPNEKQKLFRLSDPYLAFDFTSHH